MRSELIKDIAKAFESVKKPNNVDIVYPVLGLEATSLLGRYSGLDQSLIDDVTEHAGCSCEDLYSMGSVAVHYYIQAFLRYIAVSRACWEYGVVVGLIDYFDIHSVSVVYPPFTKEQIYCLCRTLHLIEVEYGSYGLAKEDQHIIKIPDIIKFWESKSSRPGGTGQV